MVSQFQKRSEAHPKYRQHVPDVERGSDADKGAAEKGSRVKRQTKT